MAARESTSRPPAPSPRDRECTLRLNIMHTGRACVNAAVKFEYPSAFSRRDPSRSEATSVHRKHEAKERREGIARHAAAANDLGEHFRDTENNTMRFVAFSRGQRAERAADARIPRSAFQSDAIIASSRDLPSTRAKNDGNKLACKTRAGSPSPSSPPPSLARIRGIFIARARPAG